MKIKQPYPGEVTTQILLLVFSNRSNLMQLLSTVIMP
jgi:hypothetical protein